MARVLVLRPEPGASATAEALRARGHEPVIFPIGEVVPLAVHDVDASRLTAVAATSANGVRHAPAPLIAELRDFPFFAVGEATASAARTAGFRRIRAADGDGQALARLVLQNLGAGDRLLYLCGHVRRSEFEQACASAAAGIVVAETYDMRYPDRGDAFRAMIRDGHPDIVMVHSFEAGRAFARLVEPFPDIIAGLKAIAISQRAAKPLSDLGIRAVAADRPDEAAMLAALARLA